MSKNSKLQFPGHVATREDAVAHARRTAGADPAKGRAFLELILETDAAEGKGDVQAKAKALIAAADALQGTARVWDFAGWDPEKGVLVEKLPAAARRMVEKAVETGIQALVIRVTHAVGQFLSPEEITGALNRAGKILAAKTRAEEEAKKAAAPAAEAPAEDQRATG